MFGWFPARVSGTSMVPTLAEGDVVAVRALRAHEPRPGQIVVIDHGHREDVKRVMRVLDDGAVWVEGDDRDRSTDSRSFGPVARAAIVGVVRLRYRPVRRFRVF